MTPLPGGFPNEGRIENAASVRITPSGLKFLGDNLGKLAPNLLGSSASGTAGVVTFPINKSHVTIIKAPIVGTELGGADVCPSGPDEKAKPPRCTAEIDLSRAKLSLSSKAPHNLLVSGTIAMRLQKLPVKGTGIVGFANVEGVLTKGGKCSPKDYADIPVAIDISVEAEEDPKHTARKGYTQIKILNLFKTGSGGTEDVIKKSVKFCGSGLDDTIINALKGSVLGGLVGGLGDSLTETLEKQLCTKEDPAAGVTCPTGTYPDTGGTCRYCKPGSNGKCTTDKDACVGLALGVDGNINLTEALSSLSPGTKGGFDFLAALGGESPRDDKSGYLWGDLNPKNQGATIGMMGGAKPKPITQCVPLANPVKPTDIPIPDELTNNTVAGWTGEGPHVGFALAERYLNYTLASVYNSGALCIGIGASTIGAGLTSSTIGILLPSFKELTRAQAASSLALVLRPQKPPRVTIGAGADFKNPHLKIAFEKLEIDFYVWSNDRFIRGFTAVFDVIAPTNLDVTADGLVPVIEEVSVDNPSLKNAELLREDEKAAAKTLAGILAGQIGGLLGGAIGPVDLNSAVASAGLTLTIPPTVKGKGSPGITKLEKGQDRFLALFATLGLAPAKPTPLQVETEASVTKKDVRLEGLIAPTIRPDNVPAISVAARATQNTSEPLEYQFRVNRGFWRPWTSRENFIVRAPELSIHGHHNIQVRARIVGKPETMDPTPIELKITIDKTPPEVKTARRTAGGKLAIEVFDAVSDQDKVLVRWALDDGPMSSWVAASDIKQVAVENATTLKIEAKDEEANIASTTQPIIRGKEDAAAASAGCNCDLSKGTPRGQVPWLLWGGFLALLGLAVQRRRAKRLRPAMLLLAGTLGASFSGCSCDTESDADPPKKKGACPGGEFCEVLEPGLVGAYSSAAIASDGTVWVSAYNDQGYGTSKQNGENLYLFGDLVVGKLEGDQVLWETVDGLPEVDETLEPGSSGGPIDPDFNDPEGFRQGLTEAGPDVGLWTSLKMVDDKPAVAYYDASERALKYAHYTGKSWKTHQVQSKPNADIGRYADLVIVDDKPTIAYLYVEGTAGGTTSGIRLAQATKKQPDGAGDWVFTNTVSDPKTPCAGMTCGSKICAQDTGVCEAKASGCDPKCGAGKTCLTRDNKPKCVASLDQTTPTTYPEAHGLYINLLKTSQGLGLAYYDRIHGNVMIAQQQGKSWSNPVLVDGQKSGAGGVVDTGDVGIGLSAVVDAGGDWHLSYVNGFDETLIYAKVTKGTTPGTPSVVDNGKTASEQVLVGDDSAIFVEGNKIQIAYQNATQGKLRWAEGSPGSWKTRDLSAQHFAGGFNQVLKVSGQTKVMTWWRRAKPRTEGDVAFVSP